MRIRFERLRLITKQAVVDVDLSANITFIHGPIGTGKSTVARLIDYCLGGELERTPALRSEFVSVQLSASFNSIPVQLERGADENSVRVTWDNENGNQGSLNAPLDAGPEPIFDRNIFNLSDLVFTFCGVEPIKVRRSKLDPDSPLVRLSLRDIMWYCYLPQDIMDSSFFRMEDPMRRLKSRDAMRFVTGLYSDRMNELDGRLAVVQQTQRSKRQAVEEIRRFMEQFGLASETELRTEITRTKAELNDALAVRNSLDETQRVQTHAAEPLRTELREMSAEIERTRQAIADLEARIEDQGALKSELITAKVKAGRAEQASRIFGEVDFTQCPRCGSNIDKTRFPGTALCYLCGNEPPMQSEASSLDVDLLRRELNDRIDDLADSIARHKRELAKLRRGLASQVLRKEALDAELARELARYDSAFVSSVRAAEKTVATLQERVLSLERVARMPSAVNELERQAGALQGEIDSLKSASEEERSRLAGADRHIAAIAEAFREIMLEVGFPGFFGDDSIILDSRNWLPHVAHRDDTWTFFDAGSGGKKTLFNVCYALALHRVASTENLPLPTFLIIDSPTKNITQDENPALVMALYETLYRLAATDSSRTQFLLIDSHLVPPSNDALGFVDRRFGTGENGDALPLIPYYRGP